MVELHIPSAFLMVAFEIPETIISEDYGLTDQTPEGVARFIANAVFHVSSLVTTEKGPLCSCPEIANATLDGADDNEKQHYKITLKFPANDLAYLNYVTTHCGYKAIPEFILLVCVPSYIRHCAERQRQGMDEKVLLRPGARLDA